MKTIWKLLSALLPCIVAPLLKKIKLELLGAYEGGVEAVRAIFSMYIMIIFVMMFSLAGFLMLHVSIFILLPLSVETKGFIFLGVGLFYFLGAFLFVVKWCSKKTWQDISGAKSIRESIERGE